MSSDSDRVEHLEHAIYDALKLLPISSSTETSAAILRGQLDPRLRKAAEQHRLEESDARG